MIEKASNLYFRTYTEVVRAPHKNGEMLTFKGANTEMTILESEFEFHLSRAEDKANPKTHQLILR